MKKLLMFAAVAAAAAGAVAAPAQAACNTGSNLANGTVVATNPADGGVVYTFGNNVGVAGPHGYIEAGEAGVQGSSTDVALEGKATTAPALCINDTVII